MAISGGIKFFKQSKCLFVKDASATATSNNSVAKNLLTSNRFVRWVSSGSNDTTTETITITMPSATIDRLFLVDINLKEFTVKYDVSGTATNFSNITGLSGSKSTISETGYSKDTAYYEFDAVTTTKIYITATKTQVANEEKSIERVYVTEELGTFEGYPQVSKEELVSNINKTKVLSGNLNVQKRLEVFQCSLSFKNYPAIQNDYDILLSLNRRVDSFLIWLCGGKDGNNFSIDRENWKLKNIYNVQVISSLPIKWNKGIYIAGFNGKIKLQQATEV